jgi:hypothetical protein
VAWRIHGPTGRPSYSYGKSAASSDGLVGPIKNSLFAPWVDLSCAVDRAILLVRWRPSVVPLVLPEDGSSHPQLHDFSVVCLLAAWKFSRRQIAWAIGVTV